MEISTKENSKVHTLVFITVKIKSAWKLPAFMTCVAGFPCKHIKNPQMISE